MTYEYPPIYWHSPESVVTGALMGMYLIICVALPLTACIYFVYAMTGCRTAKWMVYAWSISIVVQLVLMGLLRVDEDKLRDAAWFCGPGLIAAVVAVVHSSMTLNSSGPTARSNAQYTACCLLLVEMVYAFGSLPRVSSGPISTRSQCKNNLKQIGLAHGNWLEAHDGRFVDAVVHQDGQAPRSWRVELLPYIDQALLYNEYHRSRAWDSAENVGFSKFRIPVYECPAMPPELRQNAQDQFYSAYAIVRGRDTGFPDGKGMRPDDMSDGASHTAIVVEACGQQIVWSEPRDIEVTADNLGINLAGTRPNQSPAIWSSFHRRVRGASVLLADGSVRWVSKDTDPKILKALLTPSGGEAIGDF